MHGLVEGLPKAQTDVVNHWRIDRRRFPSSNLCSSCFCSLSFPPHSTTHSTSSRSSLASSLSSPYRKYAASLASSPGRVRADLPASLLLSLLLLRVSLSPRFTASPPLQSAIARFLHTLLASHLASLPSDPSFLLDSLLSLSLSASLPDSTRSPLLQSYSASLSPPPPQWPSCSACLLRTACLAPSSSSRRSSSASCLTAPP